MQQLSQSLQDLELEMRDVFVKAPIDFLRKSAENFELKIRKFRHLCRGLICFINDITSCQRLYFMEKKMIELLILK